LACVDAHGRFTFIVSDVPAAVGDAKVWNECGLDDKLRSVHGDLPSVTVFDGSDLQLSTVQPYVVADTAFRLSAHCIKCYERPDSPSANLFNAKVIRTRR
jgi:DDE superfamily endonuclease